MNALKIYSGKKIGFLGAGNLGQSIIRGLIGAGFPKGNIYATTRTDTKLEKIKKQFDINVVKNNEELVDICDIIVLGVKPQDLFNVVEPLSTSFTPDQVVVSLAAGISLGQLSRWLRDVNQLVRLMPNTAIRIGESVIGYSLGPKAQNLETLVETLFSPMGTVIAAEEGEAFQALTVATSSGIGFVFELMTYFQDWLVGYGFSDLEARQMVVKTFKGASLLADSDESIKIEELQSKVVSKKGVTHAGLTSMRELEIEGLLRMSLEKAVIRDRQLGQEAESEY